MRARAARSLGVRPPTGSVGGHALALTASPSVLRVAHHRALLAAVRAMFVRWGSLARGVGSGGERTHMRAVPRRRMIMDLDEVADPPPKRVDVAGGRERERRATRHVTDRDVGIGNRQAACWRGRRVG